MSGQYEVIAEVPENSKIYLVRFKNLKNLYIRVYQPERRTYLNRSTGLQDVEEATRWIQMNLATLMHTQPAQKPGGMTSVRRLLRDHMLYHEERLDAGLISQSTFVAYKNIYRHFDRWFHENGYRRLKDIKRTSLQKYALNRVNKDHLKIKTVNQEVMFLQSAPKHDHSGVGDTEALTPTEQGERSAVTSLMDQTFSFHQGVSQLGECLIHPLVTICKDQPTPDRSWNNAYTKGADDNAEPDQRDDY